MHDHPVDDAQRRTRLRTIVASARRQASGSRVAARDAVHGRDIDAPTGDADPFPASALRGYQILREAHRGGQGVVYEATQQSTRRRVAIKVMREGPFASLGDMARFEREVELLAQLNHPHIVAIHDSGQAAGHFYFVMDYVPGTLDEFMRGQPKGRDIQTRLRLFGKICDAVNVAHARGIIHRDLKPSNIRVDENGEPRVLDFGLAKMSDRRSPVSVGPDVDPSDHEAHITDHVTQTGQFVGSLPWASPEQAQGAAYRVDIRSDVYSLGVILYQMLTGRLPHEVTDNLHDMLSRVVRGDPPRPSTLNPGIDSDLEVIVLKCLSKEADRRYGSAGELERDIQRYCRGEAIDARRDSGWYVIRKTLRRYRGVVSAAAVFATLITASAVALSILYRQQGSLLREISVERDRAIMSEQAAELGRQKAEYESYVANIAAADGALTANDGGAALHRLDEAPAKLRNWEWRFLRRGADPSIATLHGMENHHIRHVTYSPQGGYLAGVSHLVGFPSQLDVWDLQLGAPVLTTPVDDDRTIGFFVTPFWFGQRDSQLRVFFADGAHFRYELPRPTPVDQSRVAGFPQDALVWIASPPRFVAVQVIQSRLRVEFWNEDGTLRDEFPLATGGYVNACACAPRGERFAFGQQDGLVYVCEFTSGAKPHRFRAHTTIVHGLAFSPDGQQLATSSEDGWIKVWDIAPLAESRPTESVDADSVVREVRSFRGSVQRVGGVAFSPDGMTLAAASSDKTLRIWRIADGEPLNTLRGHAGALCDVTFHPDGQHVATGSYDGTAKIWDLSQQPETIVRRDLPSLAGAGSVAFHPDSLRIAVGTTGEALLISALDGQTIRRLTGDIGVTDVLLDRDGDRAYIGGRDGSVHACDAASGHECGRYRVQPGGGIIRIALNRTGTQIACVTEGGGPVIVIDASTGVSLARFDQPSGAARRMAFSPVEDRLATGSTNGEVCVWDTTTKRPVWTAHVHSAGILSVAISADGARLATASDDETVIIQDARTGRVQTTLRPHIGDVWCAVFSPDGARLAVAGRDRTVRIFDVAKARELLTLRGPTGTVMSLSWSPDGRRIAAGSWAREVFVWDAGQP